MGEVLLDVTRLLDRSMHNRLPTGVDRVSLAYVAHFRDQARVLVRFGWRWVVLGRGDSVRIFDALIAPDDGFPLLVRWLAGRSWLFDWRAMGRGAWLFNTSHSGLDNPDYALQVRRLGLVPVFFLHDLIPITHPEYGRPGEAERHRRRLATMLLVGRGLVLNSEATRRELVAYASVLGLAV